MTTARQDGSSALRHPQKRDQLIGELADLALPDPRRAWRAQTADGLIAGIDHVFHFFFDDNDFDESAIGVSLHALPEVTAVGEVKVALDRLLAILGDASDDQFVEHANWIDVTTAARQALEVFEGS